MKNPILMIMIFGIISQSLTACQGWEPLYGTRASEVARILRQITVAPAEDTTGQFLYNALLDQLSADAHPFASQSGGYQLDWKLTKKSSNQATLSDGSAAIVQVTYRVKFQLSVLHTSDDDTLISFEAITKNRYNTNNSSLSNIEQQQQSTALAMKRLARDMVNQLALHITQNNDNY